MGDRGGEPQREHQANGASCLPGAQGDGDAGVVEDRGDEAVDEGRGHLVAGGHRLQEGPGRTLGHRRVTRERNPAEPLPSGRNYGSGG